MNFQCAYCSTCAPCTDDEPGRGARDVRSLLADAPDVEAVHLPNAGRGNPVGANRLRQTRGLVAVPRADGLDLVLLAVIRRGPTSVPLADGVAIWVPREGLTASQELKLMEDEAVFFGISVAEVKARTAAVSPHHITPPSR